MKLQILTYLLMGQFLLLNVHSTRAQESEEAGAILQREEIRRQELMLKARMQMEEAGTLIRLGKIEEAAELLTDTLATVPNVGKGAAIHEEAKSALSLIETSIARRLVEEKKWFDVKESATKALEYNPSNQEAKDLVAYANKKLGASEDGQVNPAVDNTFINRYNEVQELIVKGKDYVATGQYEKAEDTFQAVLRIDPYNMAAIEASRELNKKMRHIAELGHRTVRKKKAVEVSNTWSNNISTEEEAPELVNVQEVIQQSNQSFLADKLKNITIPSVEFTDASIEDAANFLTVKTREQDVEGGNEGVPFIVNDEAAANSKPFSLRLSNVPAGEVLRYACNLAGVKFKVSEYAVFIVPINTVSERVVTREFPVTPSFFDVAGGGDGTDPAEGRTPRFSRRPSATSSRAGSGSAGLDAKEILESRGVDFTAQAATAIYNEATGKLTVTNTQNQIDLVEELVVGTNVDSLLVKVETKFIEIDQTELDELVPNINLAGQVGYPDTSGTMIKFGSVDVGTNLADRSSLKVSDAVDSFVNSPQSVPNQISNPLSVNTATNSVGITGFLDGNAFAALISALSQSSSTELLTAPSLVVNSGEQGSISIAREFFYPTEFDEPEVQVGIGVGTTSVFVPPFTTFLTNNIRFTTSPAFPTDFEKRDVGVTMTVNPRVSVDKKRVFMAIDPEVVEFEGFINYGPRIFATDITGTTTPTVLNENRIEQPVFNVRTVENAQLEIEDGYTVVLGGLLREDVSTIEEKVPLLGDIPLVGRAFRSEVEQSVRRNLLIFVSVQILRPDGQPYNLDSPKGTISNN
ncbi:MAG: hypothetical protein AAFY98_10005 [Verrucomicrobiota bacterium]